MNHITSTIFPEREALIAAGRCPNCTTPIIMESLRDAVSRAEVGISGFCQPCQDEVFSDPETLDGSDGLIEDVHVIIALHKKTIQT